MPSSASHGLFITPYQWLGLTNYFNNITLTSTSDLVFDGTFVPGANALSAVTDTLTIDAGRIMDSVAGGSAALSAQTIALQNSTGAVGSANPAAAGGQITLNAPQIQVNQGNILFDGFAGVTMNGQNNVTFSGVGSLTMNGGGSLAIITPRVATSYYTNSAGAYTAANYTINAGTYTVTMQGTGASSASTAAPGGTLAINAGEIDVSTIVEVPSGQLDLTAVNNINLNSGGQLLALGNQYSPGGSVSLTSTGGGAINLATGSLIDVSAYQGSGSQGDAGSISLHAPFGGVALNGSIKGQANGGKGGSFSIVTNTLDTVNGHQPLLRAQQPTGFQPEHWHGRL